MIGVEVRPGRDPLGRRCVVIQVSKPDGDQFWFTVLPDEAELLATQILFAADTNE